MYLRFSTISVYNLNLKLQHQGYTFACILQVMWSYPEVLEIEKLYTNDTHQVAKTYGIEAAGRVIAAVSVLDVDELGFSSPSP